MTNFTWPRLSYAEMRIRLLDHVTSLTTYRMRTLLSPISWRPYAALYAFTTPYAACEVTLPIWLSCFLTATMDPITTLHLVTTVTSMACSFISNTGAIIQAVKAVKHAPKHAQELRKEINSVTNLLLALEEVVTQPHFIASSSLNDDLLDFKSMLDEMNAKMAIMKTEKLEQVKWPFNMKDTQDKLSKMERYKATFTMALTVDIA